MSVAIDKKSLESYNKFCLRCDRKIMYGYDGPDDLFNEWIKNRTNIITWKN